MGPLPITLCMFYALTIPAQARAQTQDPAKARNMALAGYSDLQGGSAYQPVIQQQDGRWIAYIGHHGGSALNLLTGRSEANGTPVVDVTDPALPRMLHHIPGAPGQGESSGAQMAWVCAGSSQPHGLPERHYLLRTYGNEAHEVWDVTAPTAPRRIARVGTHSSNESAAAVYYRHVVFLAHFNAGVRAVDVRDPYAMKEIGYYIPAVSARTEPQCAGGDKDCRPAMQTNNVDIDERRLIYSADRAGSGVHILRLTEDGKKAAGLAP